MSLLIAVMLAACGPGDGAGDDMGGGDDDGPGFIDAGPGAADGGQTVGEPVVYAHSSSVLYKINPDDFQVTEIGPFVWPADIIIDSMTDIAIDKDGKITGVSFNRAYAVDRQTVVCTQLSHLDREFNGLSWVPAGLIDQNEEILVGTTLDGSVWQLDPATGASTLLGEYGGGWVSSGDLVSVDGFGTIATVNNGITGSIDTLAMISFPGGTAAPIGAPGVNTGYAEIWGVGFWKGKVFGFTDKKEFLLIDVTTGVATLQQASNIFWWGAGVTTEAPIVD